MVWKHLYVTLFLVPFSRKHSIFHLDTHHNVTYFFSITLNNNIMTKEDVNYQEIPVI